MTRVATASTALTDGAAGDDLAAQILDALNGDRPDALIVFASAENDYEALLTSLDARCHARATVGCSSPRTRRTSLSESRSNGSASSWCP